MRQQPFKVDKINDHIMTNIIHTLSIALATQQVERKKRTHFHNIISIMQSHPNTPADNASGHIWLGFLAVLVPPPPAGNCDSFGQLYTLLKVLNLLTATAVVAHLLGGKEHFLLFEEH